MVGLGGQGLLTRDWPPAPETRAPCRELLFDIAVVGETGGRGVYGDGAGEPVTMPVGRLTLHGSREEDVR